MWENGSEKVEFGIKEMRMRGKCKKSHPARKRTKRTAEGDRKKGESWGKIRKKQGRSCSKEPKRRSTNGNLSARREEMRVGGIKRSSGRRLTEGHKKSYEYAAVVNYSRWRVGASARRHTSLRAVVPVGRGGYRGGLQERHAGRGINKFGTHR